MNAWRCDRCGEFSTDGDMDDPPARWGRYRLPVRGSSGARSSREAVICGLCDDDLYFWVTVKSPAPIPDGKAGT